MIILFFHIQSACKQRYTQRRLMAVDPAEPEKVYIFFKKINFSENKYSNNFFFFTGSIHS